MGYSDSKKRKKQRESDGVSRIVGACGAGVVSAILSILALSVASAFVACLGSDPDALVSYLGIAALYISSLVCGFVSARRCGENWLVCGFSSGAVLMIFLWAASYLFERELSGNYPTFAVLGMRALTVFMSALGAYISDYLSKRKRAHRRRRR